MIAQATGTAVDARATARQHLDHIAKHPRPAGSRAEDEAREYCRSVLLRSGFAVNDEPFEYSAFPGRYSTPLAGTVSIGVIVVAAICGYSSRAGTALATLLLAGLVLAVFGILIALRGVLGLGWARAKSVNLVATRGTPRVWLMAHIDTKSQPVSMAARVGGIIGSAIVWALAIILAGLSTVQPLSDEWRSLGWPILGFAGLVAGMPVAASYVGARSAGAFDNASGVSAVLMAASEVPSTMSVGVVITSAEELGLAGARAWVRGRAAGVAVNVDGVDDLGMLTAMTTRSSSRVAASFHRSATAAGIEHRTIRLVPGVLADSVALTDAGWESITVSHGSLKSLARIHTANDVADRITGEGIVRATIVMRRMLTELAS